MLEMSLNLSGEKEKNRWLALLHVLHTLHEERFREQRACGAKSEPASLARFDTNLETVRDEKSYYSYILRKRSATLKTGNLGRSPRWLRPAILGDHLNRSRFPAA
jgi:hypothetical protein